MIGTSAGGVEPLKAIVAGFPDRVPAAVFVVMHIPPWRHTRLPEILSVDGAMKVSHPEHHERIEQGHIYVAPPDYHMLIQPNESITLWHGPKESNFRPAINPLFRSAADTYKQRVIGILLSGALDDGVAGLWWIKRHGGVAMVQDPNDAQFPNMPQSALLHVPVDHVLPVSAMSNVLIQMANGRSEL